MKMFNVRKLIQRVTYYVAVSYGDIPGDRVTTVCRHGAGAAIDQEQKEKLQFMIF